MFLNEGLHFECLPARPLSEFEPEQIEEEAVTERNRMHWMGTQCKQKSHLLTRQYHIVQGFLTEKTNSDTAVVCVRTMYLVL